MNKKELRIPFNALLNEVDTELQTLWLPSKQSRHLWEQWACWYLCFCEQGWNLQKTISCMEKQYQKLKG